MNEIDLLSRARQGDRHAFEEGLRPVIQPAFRLALAMLGERGAAEDAVQEMALKGWRHRHHIRPELGTVRPWFLAIVANECRMARRQRWWSVLRSADPVEGEACERDVATGIDLRTQLERLAYHERLLRHLYYVLDPAPAEVTQVLSLRGVAVATLRRPLAHR